MNFLNQGKLRSVATLAVATCLLTFGTISPATAEETIENISPEVFECLKKNNVNDRGYVTYEDNGVMWVGPGRPGDPGGIKMRYSYDGKKITLTGTGGWDLANVLGQTRDGINSTANKCKNGELR